LKAWNESRNRLQCPICHHQTYLTAGTIFEKIQAPPTAWFEAAWHLTTVKTIERTLGISYGRAWMMLQRFRVVMVDKERKRLSGEARRNFGW